MRRSSSGVALIFALLLTPNAARAQAPPKLEFEVATVRASAARVPGQRPEPARRSGGPGTADPGRLSFSNQPLSTILADAFNVYWNQITGPDWIGDQYDIVAKVPAGATKEQAKQMLQNLLVERFHLTYHMQTKIVDGYELTVAPGGPKLTEHSVSSPGPEGAAAGKDNFPVPPLAPGEDLGRHSQAGRVYMRFANTSISEFARRLGGNLSSASMVMVAPRMLMGAPPPILDKTGLTGAYDFTFDYAGGTFFAASARPTMVGSIESSLTKQLGLKMAEAKVPVNVLVIDHIDRTPTEN